MAAEAWQPRGGSGRKHEKDLGPPCGVVKSMLGEGHAARRVADGVNDVGLFGAMLTFGSVVEQAGLKQRGIVHRAHRAHRAHRCCDGPLPREMGVRKRANATSRRLAPRDRCGLDQSVNTRHGRGDDHADRFSIDGEQIRGHSIATGTSVASSSRPFASSCAVLTISSSRPPSVARVAPRANVNHAPPASSSAAACSSRP